MAATDVLTKKLGGLPGWQWAALLGAGGGLFLLVRKRSSAGTPASSSGTGDLTSPGDPYGPNTGGEVLAPIILGNGNGSTPISGAAGLTAADAKRIATLEAQNQRQGKRLNALESAKKVPAPKPAQSPKRPATKVAKKAPAKKTAPPKKAASKAKVPAPKRVAALIKRK